MSSDDAKMLHVSLCITQSCWMTTFVKTCPILLLFPQNATENAVYVNALSFDLSYPLSKGGKSEILRFYSGLYHLLLFY